MENLGSLAVLLAFCLAVYAIIGSVVGRLKRNPFLILSAERAVYSVWFLITVASAVLVYALVTGDFRYSYVAQYSNRAMSPAYKFSAWWGGPCCRPSGWLTNRSSRWCSGTRLS